jgi:hypothetical protein
MTFHFLLYFMDITLYLQSKKKKKGKVFLILAMKAYRGRRGNAPLNLNLGTVWRRVVKFTLGLLLKSKVYASEFFCSLFSDTVNI